MTPNQELLRLFFFGSPNTSSVLLKCLQFFICKFPYSFLRISLLFHVTDTSWRQKALLFWTVLLWLLPSLSPPLSQPPPPPVEAQYRETSASWHREPRFFIHYITGWPSLMVLVYGNADPSSSGFKCKFTDLKTKPPRVVRTCNC